MNASSVVLDVIGVLQGVEEIGQVYVPGWNRKVDKRALRLLDETGSMATLTLWGDCAKNFQFGEGEHPVLLFEGVTVKEFHQGLVIQSDFCLADWYIYNFRL